MNKNDVVIKELLDDIKKQKLELKKYKRSSLITNGLYTFKHKNININTINNISTIVELVADLVITKTGYTEACKILNVHPIETNTLFGGYLFDDWIIDFKSRIKTIEYNKRKTVLDASEHKLNELMSTDAKTASDLDKLKELILQ